MANSIGARLKEARIASGLTQTDLGCVMGYTKQGMSNFELGKREIPLFVLRLVCEVLGVSSEWLIWGTGKKTSGRRLNAPLPSPPSSTPRP